MKLFIISNEGSDYYSTIAAYSENEAREIYVTRNRDEYKVPFLPTSNFTEIPEQAWTDYVMTDKDGKTVLDYRTIMQHIKTPQILLTNFLSIHAELGEPPFKRN